MSHSNGFVNIPRSAVGPCGLTPQEKLIYYTIREYDYMRTAYGQAKGLSISFMAKHLELCKNTIRKYLRRLIEKGRIIVLQAHDSITNSPAVYKPAPMPDELNETHPLHQLWADVENAPTLVHGCEEGPGSKVGAKIRIKEIRIKQEGHRAKKDATMEQKVLDLRVNYGLIPLSEELSHGAKEILRFVPKHNQEAWIKGYGAEFLDKVLSDLNERFTEKPEKAPANLVSYCTRVLEGEREKARQNENKTPQNDYGERAKVIVAVAEHLLGLVQRYSSYELGGKLTDWQKDILREIPGQTPTIRNATSESYALGVIKKSLKTCLEKNIFSFDDMLKQ